MICLSSVEEVCYVPVVCLCVLQVCCLSACVCQCCLTLYVRSLPGESQLMLTAGPSPVGLGMPQAQPGYGAATHGYVPMPAGGIPAAMPAYGYGM